MEPRNFDSQRSQRFWQFNGSVISEEEEDVSGKSDSLLLGLGDGFKPTETSRPSPEMLRTGALKVANAIDGFQEISYKFDRGEPDLKSV